MISQCRCPSKDKEVRYGICNECKAVPAPQGKESEGKLELPCKNISIADDPAAEVCPIVTMYNELLHAVESKHNGETRHETALKYIKQVEIGRNIASKEGGSSGNGT